MSETLGKLAYNTVRDRILGGLSMVIAPAVEKDGMPGEDLATMTVNFGRYVMDEITLSIARNSGAKYDDDAEAMRALEKIQQRHLEELLEWASFLVELHKRREQEFKSSKR